MLQSLVLGLLLALGSPQEAGCPDRGWVLMTYDLETEQIAPGADGPLLAWSEGYVAEASGIRVRLVGSYERGYSLEFSKDGEPRIELLPLEDLEWNGEAKCGWITAEDGRYRFILAPHRDYFGHEHLDVQELFLDSMELPEGRSSL
jgi:hypothetical protein